MINGVKRTIIFFLFLASTALFGWSLAMSAEEAPGYITVVDASSGFSGDPITGPHTASMKWDTTTPSKTIARYGETIYRDKRVKDDVLRTQHALYLDQLIPRTTYILTIETEGANGVMGSAQIFFFTTKDEGMEEAPRFTNGGEEKASSEKKTGSLGLTIDWDGLDAQIESTYFVPTSDYQYQWLAVSSPTFSDIQRVRQEGNATIISLTSTIPEGELAYDVRYGTESNTLLFSATALDGSRATLRGIDPARPYAFQVESRRRDGSRQLITAKSRTIHSSELSAPLKNIDPPKFSAIRAVNGPTSHRMVFTASSPVRAEWEYKVIGKTGDNQTLRQSSLQATHDMALEKLVSNERYRSELRITDQWGNETGYIIEFRTRKSGEEPETIIDITHPVGQQYSFYKGAGDIMFYGIGEYVSCTLSPKPESSHGSSHSQVENRKPPYYYNHRFSFTPTRDTYTVTCSKRDGSSVSQALFYPEVKPLQKKEETKKMEEPVKKQEPVKKEEQKMEEKKQEEPKTEVSKKEEPKKEEPKAMQAKQQERDQEVKDIQVKAKALYDQKFDTLLTELNELRNRVKEQEVELKYLKKLTTDVQNLTASAKESITNFIAYGVDSNTKGLGAGERAAVAHSYKAAYGKFPKSDQDLSDMILIANGRFPSERNVGAEAKASRSFKQIYKRVPNLKNSQNDVAAVMVMAYGLRQAAEHRNLSSERRGIETFKGIFARMPQTTDEWNIMQAITYSGATRKPDTDKDLLADEDEKTYGTDPYNPNSDTDGYNDGLEIENGYDPLGAGRVNDTGWLLPAIR